MSVLLIYDSCFKTPVLLWSQYIQLVLQPNIYCYLFNNIYFYILGKYIREKKLIIFLSTTLFKIYIFFLFNYIISSSWLYIERKNYSYFSHLLIQDIYILFIQLYYPIFLIIHWEKKLFIFLSPTLFKMYIFFLFNYIISSSWLYIERKSYWIYSTNSYIYSLSYFTVLFRCPISLSYFAVLFHCPISLSYFAVLFRRPISATYFPGASSCGEFAYHIS